MMTNQRNPLTTVVSYPERGEGGSNRYRGNCSPILNRDGFPKVATTYDNMFRGLAKKYNKCHEEALPKVMTPHTLRHTFCTNLANAGMNPKALQYIMGHSNIPMTLNYYAHATFASARAEMERLIAA